MGLLQNPFILGDQGFKVYDLAFKVYGLAFKVFHFEGLKFYEY